jgi:hypothetical protein
MKRIAATGGRGYHDWRTVNETLDALALTDGVSEVIVGDADGADRWVRDWATSRGVALVVCRADWERYGPAAGPIRNRAALAHRPDVVVAFPGGKGTADMVRQAERAGIDVVRAGAWS